MIRGRLSWQGDLGAHFLSTGRIPLPPYIRRADDGQDRLRYQTVYAREDRLGSVAAPTAGLHFTPEILERSRSEERRVGKECRSRWSPYH